MKINVKIKKEEEYTVFSPYNSNMNVIIGVTIGQENECVYHRDTIIRDSVEYLLVELTVTQESSLENIDISQHSNSQDDKHIHLDKNSIQDTECEIKEYDDIPDIVRSIFNSPDLISVHIIRNGKCLIIKKCDFYNSDEYLDDPLVIAFKDYLETELNKKFSENQMKQFISKMRRNFDHNLTIIQLVEKSHTYPGEINQILVDYLVNIIPMLIFVKKDLLTSFDKYFDVDSIWNLGMFGLYLKNKRHIDDSDLEKIEDFIFHEKMCEGNIGL